MTKTIEEKIEEIKKRLNSIEEGLSEDEKDLARTELNTLIIGINADLEEYLAKMKSIGAQKATS